MAARSLIVLCMLCLYGCAVMVVEGTFGEQQRPGIFHKTICPNYKVLNKYEGFEHRRYEPSNWIMTPLGRQLDTESIVPSYHRLTHYIDGYNKDGKIIERTSPTVIILSLRDASEDKMLFFLPPGVDCPDPIENTVTCVHFPLMYLYVKTFIDDAGPYNCTHNAKILARELMAHKKPFQTSFVGCNYYMNAAESGENYNEVWLVATKQPQQ